jgi:hypothetical protein
MKTVSSMQKAVSSRQKAACGIQKADGGRLSKERREQRQRGVNSFFDSFYCLLHPAFYFIKELT